MRPVVIVATHWRYEGSDLLIDMNAGGYFVATPTDGGQTVPTVPEYLRELADELDES